ncbi:unnamed protein product, partial [Laminaria digitata]
MCMLSLVMKCDLLPVFGLRSVHQYRRRGTSVSGWWYWENPDVLFHVAEAGPLRFVLWRNFLLASYSECKLSSLAKLLLLFATRTIGVSGIERLKVGQPPSPSESGRRLRASSVRSAWMFPRGQPPPAAPSASIYV